MKVNSFMPRGSAPIIPRDLWPFVRSEPGVGRRSDERMKYNGIYFIYNLTINAVGMPLGAVAVKATGD